MNIKEIKNLNYGYRLLICVIITIIGWICLNLLVNDFENKVESYDYSQVYPIKGVITKIWWESGTYRYDAPTAHISAYMNVDLENGETVKIGLGGSTSSYSEGNDITIYTDGTYYSITQKGVADGAQRTIYNLLGCCVIAIFVLVIWTWLFGWRGFLVAFLLLIAILLY